MVPVAIWLSRAEVKVWMGKEDKKVGHNQLHASLGVVVRLFEHLRVLLFSKTASLVKKPQKDRD